MARKKHSREVVSPNSAPRCSGKVCYSKRDAQARRNVKLRHKRDAKTLRIYNCPDCGQWHLTSSA